MPKGPFTEEEIAFLRENYPQRGKRWCCEMMDRSEASIRQRAYKLGLRQDRASPFFQDWQARAAASKVGKKRPGHSAYMKARFTSNPTYKAETVARMHEGFRRAMQQSEYRAKTIARITSAENLAKAAASQQRPDLRATHSANGKHRWTDNADFRAKAMARFQSQENRRRLSKQMTDRLTSQANVYSRTQSGKRNINGREQFFRSKWEANVARTLDFQGRRWEYETKTFWFEKIKKGARSYTPDFYLPDENLFIEVKGWWDAKSLTKKKRMAKYYPEIKIEYWDSQMYRALERQLSALLKDWE